MARTAPGSPRPAGPPPDEAALRGAALTYLARYSATQTGLLRVLNRRIARWARAAEAPSEATHAPLAAARAVVAQLAAAGVVDDAAFAEGRARALHRAGRSRRAIAAHLQAKGVPASLAAPPDDPAAELAAALLYSHRRRMGPFRPVPDAALRPVPDAALRPVPDAALRPVPDAALRPVADAALRRRDLARLGRAGFPAAVACRALDLDPGEAETLLLEARRG
jgi:regulatory protein